MSATDIDQVRSALAELTERMGWAPMQTPRNMTLALTSHIGSVAGHLQFAPDGAEAQPANAELAGEVADCLVYLVALADGLGVDMAAEAVRRLTAGLAGEQSAGVAP